MNFKSFFIKSVLVLFACVGINAQAADTLTPLVIQHCSESFCFELKSEKGFRSQLDANMLTFNKAEIKILDKLTQKLQRLERGDSGYMDSEMGYLVLRGAKGKKSLMLNINSGTISIL